MKNILIVGATSAIAAACARRWCEGGARFYLVGRSADKLRQVANDLSARGAEVQFAALVRQFRLALEFHDQVVQHPFHQFHHVAVVAVGEIRLQPGEFRVVRAVHALVAVVAPDFVHAFETANDQALQIQFRRHAQEQVQVQRVGVGDERPGRRAAVQIRGLLNGVFLQHAGAAAEARVFTALRTRLMSPEAIALERVGDLAGALLAVVTELVEDKAVTDESWARLAAFYDDRKLVEIVMLATNYDGLATAIDVLGIQPEKP